MQNIPVADYEGSRKGQIWCALHLESATASHSPEKQIIYLLIFPPYNFLQAATAGVPAAFAGTACTIPLNTTGTLALPDSLKSGEKYSKELFFSTLPWQRWQPWWQCGAVPQTTPPPYLVISIYLINLYLSVSW